MEAFGQGVKSEEEEAMRETVGGSLLCDSSPVLVRLLSLLTLLLCALAYRRDFNLET